MRFCDGLEVVVPIREGVVIGLAEREGGWERRLTCWLAYKGSDVTRISQSKLIRKSINYLILNVPEAL